MPAKPVMNLVNAKDPIAFQQRVFKLLTILEKEYLEIFLVEGKIFIGDKKNEDFCEILPEKYCSA